VPDRGNDVADRVAKFCADGKFSAHGEFEDIERLHNDYKTKFDLASPDEILIGVHSGAGGSDDETLACVDGACDTDRACGRAFTLSDGDSEHSGMGSIAPRADAEVAGANVDRLILKASLLATITALECAEKVNSGRKRPISVRCLRKNLWKELVVGRLTKLSDSNMLHQEIVHVHATINRLAIAGCLVTFKAAEKKCDSMRHVRMMAEQAKNSSYNDKELGQAKEVFESMPLVEMKGGLEMQPPGPQWPRKGEQCWHDGCSKVFKEGGPTEVLSHVNKKHKLDALPPKHLDLMPHQCRHGCGVRFLHTQKTKIEAHCVVCPLAPANFDPEAAEDGPPSNSDETFEQTCARRAEACLPFENVSQKRVQFWGGCLGDVHRDLAHHFRRHKEVLARGMLEMTNRRPKYWLPRRMKCMRDWFGENLAREKGL
jgi:hypothetical protein